MARNIVVIIAVLGVVGAQDYSDDHNKYPDDFTQSNVPKHFEASGPDALKTISKYVSAIEKTAEMTNSIATFKIQVIMERKHKTKHGQVKPTKSKKFKVPLKKKNLRLSSYEIESRRIASDHNEKMAKVENYSDTTTEKEMIIQATKKNKVGKYKPYISGVKTKYHKHVKPVANKEIVLNLP